VPEDAAAMQTSRAVGLLIGVDGVGETFQVRFAASKAPAGFINLRLFLLYKLFALLLGIEALY
jgi:hypothetical protein